jgi:hypothetical protein
MARQFVPDMNRTDTKQYPTNGRKEGEKTMTTRKPKATKAEVKAKMREARAAIKADPTLTHVQLAEKCGLSPATVGRYLAGKQKRGKTTQKPKAATTPTKTAGELQTLVQNLEEAKQALRDYLEAYLSL